MKKIKKSDLRLEKEVISNLSQADLIFVKGGGVYSGRCEKTEGCVHPVSYYPQECLTLECEFSVNTCMSGGDTTCLQPITGLKTVCEPILPVESESPDCPNARL